MHVIRIDFDIPEISKSRLSRDCLEDSKQHMAGNVQLFLIIEKLIIKSFLSLLYICSLFYHKKMPCQDELLNNNHS